MPKLLSREYTPEQRLYHAIFEKLPERDITEKEIPELWKVVETLTARESTIIKLRCGFDCEPMAYRAIGEKYDVGCERIRQIEVKALRKLKHPGRAKSILPLFYTYEEMKSDLEAKMAERDQQISELNASNVALIAENQALRQGYPAMQQCLESALRSITNYATGFAVVQQSLEAAIGAASACVNNEPVAKALFTAFPDTDEIEALDFSIRTYNCLKRIGVSTLNELIERYQDERLLKIRNLGRKGIDEVESKLISLGIARVEHT